MNLRRMVLSSLFVGFIVIASISAYSEIHLPSPINTKARKQELLPLFQKLKISGPEAVVRLILSETMATHCEAISKGRVTEISIIMNGIAKVIRNRVKDRNREKELAVVFSPNQFNSSLGQYPCSEIEGFLDPRHYEERANQISASQLWSLAGKAYEDSWSQKVFAKNDDKIKNYYLPEHHQQGRCKLKIPSWVQAQNEVPLVANAPSLESIRKCIGFYLL